MEANLEISDVLRFETVFFVKTVAFGLCIRFFYDFLIVLRKMLLHKSIAVGIEDFIFCMLSSVSVFCMFYYENNGSFRMYGIFGIFIGITLYHITLSRLVCFVLVKLFCPIAALYKFLKKSCHKMLK